MSQTLRLLFAGTPEFAVPALDALAAAGHELLGVYTRPDRPAGRGLRLSPSPVKLRALELGVGVEQPASLRTPEAQQRLAAYGADLLVVVAYGLLLPPAVLAAPRLGCLNIHASLLPRWRGAAPIQRAILAGDPRSGVTIMCMEEGLDTGPVLLAEAVALGPRETGGSLHDRLAGLGARLVVAAIEQWQTGRIEPVAQAAEAATYAAKIRKEEALIDWSRPSIEIDRQVRAFNPWPVAETRWRGEQLRIWEAEVEPGLAGGEPGRVLRAAAGELLVATGDAALRVLRLQLAGRRATGAAEFLNAHDPAGARLGA